MTSGSVPIPPGGTGDPSSVLTPDVDAGAQAAPVTPGAPLPDLASTREAMGRPAARSYATVILAALAVLYTFHFAKDFLLPIAFALLLDFLFSPFVRALARYGIRPPLGAAIVVLGLIGALSWGVYELSGPAQRWIENSPQTVATARAKLGTLIAPLERMGRTAEQVQRATVGGNSAEEPERVVVEGPSLVSRAFGTTQKLVTTVIEILVLLFFLLAAGDLFLQKLVKVLPRVGDKQAAVTIARKTESSISTYLLTQFLVNIGEAIVVTGAMYLLGMPNPLLWGFLVVILELIPYIGAGIMVIVLTLAALTTFDSVGHALLVPGVFLLINIIQGNLISPLLHAERLTLNPVAIIIGLAFWWWIWGIPGAFIAVPLLAAVKIICDHIAPLAPFGEFLGQRDAFERRALVR